MLKVLLSAVVLIIVLPESAIDPEDFVSYMISLRESYADVFLLITFLLSHI